jgi:hypothetical protein
MLVARKSHDRGMMVAAVKRLFAASTASAGSSPTKRREVISQVTFSYMHSPSPFSQGSCPCRLCGRSASPNGGGRQDRTFHRPGLYTALRKRAINPCIRFLPVARNRVPQYAGHPLRRQHIDDDRIEQPFIQIAALPEWAKKAVRMGERANRVLSIADFRSDDAGVLEEPERHRVAPGMIADPVALLVRTSSQFASFGRAYFIPDHEEGRANGSAREHV